jgi:hypothetical protein
MSADVPNGLTPIDKAQPSADVKSSVFQMRKTEEGEDRSELIPESDRVQISNKAESTQSEMMQHLVTDKNLNEYVIMLKQAAEIENDGAPDSSPKNVRSTPGQKTDYRA